MFEVHDIALHSIHQCKLNMTIHNSSTAEYCAITVCPVWTVITLSGLYEKHAVSFSFERTLNSNSQYTWLFIQLYSTLIKHSKHKLCLAVLCVNTFSQCYFKMFSLEKNFYSLRFQSFYCFIGSLQENVSNSFYYIVSLSLFLRSKSLLYYVVHLGVLLPCTVLLW